MNSSNYPSLILGSESPYKKALLDLLQIPFSCDPPKIDEGKYKEEGLAPVDLVLLLAQKKREKIVSQNPTAVVIASDQILNLDGQIFDKPGTPEKAQEHLRNLSGKSHELISSISVEYQGEVFDHTEISYLKMRDLSEKEIQDYVQLENPTNCCGAYKLESTGICLFSEVKTTDFTSAQGLPLIALTTILKKFYPIPLLPSNP